MQMITSCATFLNFFYFFFAKGCQATVAPVLVRYVSGWMIDGSP